MSLNLWGTIQKVEEADDGTITVYGIASTEDVDSAGEIVRADAIRAAKDKYMSTYPALREMHGNHAAGKTVALEVGDDNITRIEALVVDRSSVEKVKRGVLAGFSIGGKVTARDPSDRKIITGVSLHEISLVDRPACGAARLEYYKADMVGSDIDIEMDPYMTDTDLVEDSSDISKRKFDTAERKKDAKNRDALPDGSFPIENKEDLRNAIRAYGRAKDKDAAKRHIMSRARALGAEDMIPDEWKGGKAKKADGAEDLAKAVEPAPINATPVGDVLNDSQTTDSDTPGAPVAGRSTNATLPGNGPETAVEVKNPEEAGQATPKPLGETEVAAVEHTNADPKPGAGSAPRGTPSRNATQDTSRKAADSEGKGGKGKRMSDGEDDEKEPSEEDNDTQDTADRKKDDKKAADDPMAQARAAADNAMKAATAVLQKLAKQKSGISPVLAPGAELRKDLATTGRLGYLLCELSYILSSATYEAAYEGDNSPVPDKLRASLESLAAAYKAMSDEELQELLDAADQTMGGSIALAAAGGDIAKAFEGVVDADALAKMAGNENHEAELAKAERDELLKTIGPMTEMLQKMSAEIDALKETPLPPKTVALPAGIEAVSKAADTAGRNPSVESTAPAAPTTEEVRKALESMPQEDRSLLLMRAALSPANATVWTR